MQQSQVSCSSTRNTVLISAVFIYVSNSQRQSKLEIKLKHNVGSVGMPRVSRNWRTLPGHVSGAFLIPYYIMMFVCSIPLLLMELAVGQFTQRGPVGAMARLCPLFKGQYMTVAAVTCAYFSEYVGRRHRDPAPKYSVGSGWLNARARCPRFFYLAWLTEYLA